MADVALRLLSFASILGGLLTAWKLSRHELARVYRFFFGYLIFRALYGLPLLSLNLKSNWYEYIYVACWPVCWGFYVGTVLELYRLILARHRGFYTLGRWAMCAALAISAALSAAALLPKITPQMPQPTVVMGYLIAGERAIDASLAVFLLLMLAFLNVYTVPLARNTLAHAAIYTVFFLSSTLRMMLASIFGIRLATAFDLGMAATSCACLLAWFILLNAKGEEMHLSVPWFGPEREERILYRLDALNATLMRAGK
ncbi:MAG: hypothetical protein LAQ30_08850 [Acidobacteriia bacterium]|nr:hypothetical protein [Terriglobia bacterium]